MANNGTDFGDDIPGVDVPDTPSIAPLSPGFMILSSIIVLFMQLGFAQLEVGVSPQHSAQNIFMKNMLDTAIGAIGFYALGYGLAYGDGPLSNGFIGSGNFFSTDISPPYAWFVQFAYANNAATIAGGPLVGRTRLSAYMLLSLFISVFVYPVFTHWLWSSKGWLRTAFEYRPLDFVGGGPVHLLGGMAGLVGSWIVGPRATFEHVLTLRDKYESAHNKILAASGTYLLWVSWLSFTSVSAGAALQESQVDTVGRIAMCTMLSGSAAGVASYVITKCLGLHYDIIHLGNSMLVGLAAITSGCGFVQPWAAVFIGFSSSFLFLGMCRLIQLLRIDDPVDAAAIHITGGVWGLIATGLFAEPKFVANNYLVRAPNAGGLFYGGNGKQFAMQLLEIAAAVGWTFCCMGAMYYALRRLGKLRISKESELGGLDLFKHAAPAPKQPAPGAVRDQEQPRIVDTNNPFNPRTAAPTKRITQRPSLAMRNLFEPSNVVDTTNPFEAGAKDAQRTVAGESRRSDVQKFTAIGYLKSLFGNPAEGNNQAQAAEQGPSRATSPASAASDESSIRAHTRKSTVSIGAPDHPGFDVDMPEDTGSFLDYDYDPYYARGTTRGGMYGSPPSRYPIPVHPMWYGGSRSYPSPHGWVPYTVSPQRAAAPPDVKLEMLGEAQETAATSQDNPLPMRHPSLAETDEQTDQINRMPSYGPPPHWHAGWYMYPPPPPYLYESRPDDSQRDVRHRRPNVNNNTTTTQTNNDRTATTVKSKQRTRTRRRAKSADSVSS